MAGNNSTDNDEILDRYLEGKSEISDQYRSTVTETPPRHLDRAVLSAARKALRARKPVAFSPFASDWHIPVSLAAVLVLSVALVVILREESELPSIEEPLQQARPEAQEDLRNGDNVAAVAAKKTLPAGTDGSAMERSARVPEPSPAPVLKESTAAEAVQDAGTEETAAAPEFDELFIAEERSKPGGRGSGLTTGDVEGVLSRPPPNTSGRQKPTVLRSESSAMLLAPSPPAASGNEVAAAEAPAAGSRSSEQKSSVQSAGKPRLIIRDLTGQWSGTATTTPVGPVAYDITFKPETADCISGTAHPGTHHTWTFCPGARGLTLDFLTDFRGNQTPIHFRQLAYNDGVYTFKAATHEFMEVLVFAGEASAWMKIFHYGKLHVEIQLKRK